MARSSEPGNAQYNEENLEHARQLRAETKVNVGAVERVFSAMAGAALVAFAFRNRRWLPVLLPVGTGLLARAVTGHSVLNDLLGRNTAFPTHSTLGSVTSRKAIRVEKAVTIDRPVEDLYAFWHDFENLPRFIDHLESVINVGDHRSHWIARGPAGIRLEWDTELLNEEKNGRIAWRSLPNADVDHAGSVHFTAATGGRGTEVRIILSYAPPGGKVGATIVKLLGNNPARQISSDLTRFKAMMESGEEVPTSRTRRTDGVS